MPMLKLTLRVDYGAAHLLGPGKIRLLEAIEQHGSISAGGRTLGMSYRRAWLLIDELNQLFRERVVTTQQGGPRGGGAGLTDFGRDLVRRYRMMEAEAASALDEHLQSLRGSLSSADGAPAPSGDGPGRP